MNEKRKIQQQQQQQQQKQTEAIVKGLKLNDFVVNLS